MTNPQNPPRPIPPPGRHQLAVMIWLAVFPTLTVLNMTLGDQLESMSTVVRTLVLATIAVPIVIYGLMPHLHRGRARLLSRRRVSRGGRASAGSARRGRRRASRR